METIKIPSPSTILDSADAPPAAARGKPASPPKRTKQIATATQKPKQTKSRNGCITCKAKRLKCDETKPTCQQCERRKVTCGGYKKDFKWRPFEETNLAAGRPIAKPKKANTAANTPLHSLVSVINPPKLSTSPTTKQSTSPIREPSNPNDTLPQGPSLQSSPASSKSFLSADTQSADEYPVFPEEYSTNEETVPDIGVSASTDSDPFDFLSFLDPFQHVVPLGDDLIPDTEFDGPGTGPMVFGPPEFHSTSAPELSFTELMCNNGEIEETLRPCDTDAGPWNLTSSGQHETPFDFSSLTSRPTLAPDSQEMLAVRFDKITCGILSIKDGITENPWRTLIWPLAKDTPALYHAIFALSAFHCSKENPSVRVQGVKHMRQSMTCLRQQFQSMRADTALATSLALAFADTWDQNTRTCVQHLRGARALMLQVLNAGLQGGLSGGELDRVRFLYNTWTYMDVIARLTSLDDSGPEDHNPDIFQLPGDAVHEIDPLMGCASTLFPIIGRVARLVQRVRKTSTNSVSIVAQAMELKSLVEQWEPPQWFEQPEDPTSDVQHSVQVAYAYRWATLLYLHQAVPEMPSEPAEELAKRVLILLATVPYTSRTVIVQMFPLLAAGAEVDMPDDRKWVMDRWTTIQSRLMLGGIDRCLDVLREVWARRDALKVDKQQQGIVTRRTKSLSSEKKGKTGSALDGSDAASRAFHGRIHPRDNERSVQSRSGSTSKSTPSRRGSAFSPLENIEFERTVRSKLHWLNVMTEWGWEVFLG